MVTEDVAEVDRGGTMAGVGITGGKSGLVPRERGSGDRTCVGSEITDRLDVAEG